MSHHSVRTPLFLLICLLAAGALLIAGCNGAAENEEEPIPTAIPTITDAEQAPAPVVAARDAALTFIRSSYDVNLPGMTADWHAAYVTPEGIVGSGTYQFVADTCLVTVSYPIVQPADTLYTVVLEDDAQHFRWEGLVDPSGRVSETAVRPRPEAELCVDERSGAAMSYADARAIAAAGACAAEGPLGEEHFCNAGTGTWWIDLDVEKPGCNPACVVDVNSGTATVNWRCTGLIPPDEQESAAPAHDYGGWVAYRNPGMGYRLMYPAGLEVQAAPDGAVVSFNGPLVENERWPMISVNHYGSEFYRPPAGVDLETWVLDHVPAYDEMDRQRTIAGLPAVHLRTAATPQSYAFDEYYVLHQGRLIRILLLHSGGREDWDFYNQFLDGFTLESSLPPIAGGSVAGWTGTVQRNPVGSQVADYFRRSDGEIFGIHAYDDEALNAALAEAAWTGAEIRVSGTLVTGIPDAENRQIQVAELDILSGSSDEIRNLSVFATAGASSALPSDRMGTYHAWSVVEGIPTQPWSEGAEGPGIGQWIQLDFPGELELNRLTIHNGYGYSEEVYRANNRVRRATLLFSNGESVTIDLADTPEPQEIVLARAPGPNIETFFVRLIIDEVYPGTRYDDTCLGEVAVYGRVLGDMPSY